MAETINSALRSIGPATEDRMRDILADFDNLNLSGEERLSAVATTIAATAHNHHQRHKMVYLDAVRTWSLEISAELSPTPLRLRVRADLERVADGADILVTGIDSLIELMAASAVRTQDRLVTELAVVARLLGQHDARTIHMTLSAVDRALAEETFEPGTVVTVPLRELNRLVSRESNLAQLEPRGYA
ncbi:MAG: hypothetical protein JO010_06660 [Alphaproteobacteria bacterium]|nr:hypothetical protein [Alphaproteobacteria bacterium]